MLLLSIPKSLERRKVLKETNLSVNQLNEGTASGKKLNDRGQILESWLKPTFRRTAGGRLSKSILFMVEIGALIFISGLLETTPAVQHDTRRIAGPENSSDEEEQS